MLSCNFENAYLTGFPDATLNEVTLLLLYYLITLLLLYWLLFTSNKLTLNKFSMDLFRDWQCWRTFLKRSFLEFFVEKRFGTLESTMPKTIPSTPGTLTHTPPYTPPFCFKFKRLSRFFFNIFTKNRRIFLTKCRNNRFTDKLGADAGDCHCRQCSTSKWLTLISRVELLFLKILWTRFSKLTKSSCGRHCSETLTSVGGYNFSCCPVSNTIRDSIQCTKYASLFSYN